MLQNLLLSEAIGDIAGSAYEFHPVKDYDLLTVFHPRAKFTDDTVLTFACAQALTDHKDMTACIRQVALQYPRAGYGGIFRWWINQPDTKPYNSFGNGSAMRCSAAGWLATTEEQCINLAMETAAPTHNHPEGIKGAVVTALCIFWLKQGKGKDFVRHEILEKYYPDWADSSYAYIHDAYGFNSSCQGTVGPAIISFLESKDYLDCIKLAIALGGDADTLAAICGPMAYAHYRDMPPELVQQARVLLPDWMVKLSDRFDALCNIPD